MFIKRINNLWKRITFPSRIRCVPSRSFTSSGSNGEHDDRSRDASVLAGMLDLPAGIRLDEIDKIMSDDTLEPTATFYPIQEVGGSAERKPLSGHNVLVIQPWDNHLNLNEFTDPQLQLKECVSLGNTIHNWKVVDKRIVYASQLNRRQILSVTAFEELKETILSKQGISAVFFGVELLSAIQLATLERELKLAVYDRFTVVLNIFRQHARTKEAKLQLALAELPYIRSHLREIHESSEYSSTAESIKYLVGGAGEKLLHQRVNILKQRERRLRFLLEEIRKQRNLTKKQRKKGDIPTVSIVGYTNCGKTTLIKYLTQDERLKPKDQLFATLDVSVHMGHLPSTNKVFYLDTVGFISRIPLLLVDAFSATLNDVQESDLIVHLLDVSHPDHRLQRVTVNKALESLKIPKNLLQTKLTIGNKADLIREDCKELPECDMNISVTKNVNMSELVKRIDQQLMGNLNHAQVVLRVQNGGQEYRWLMKNSTILDCGVDEADVNHLICRVIFSPAASGRWRKRFGSKHFLQGQ